MKMKSVKIIYWVFTALLIVLMLFSAVASFMPKNPDAVAMMQHLGYPYRVLEFLGVAKILGIIALLIPGYPRLKEWAYAGFTFDLVGAIFAGLSAGDPITQWIPVVIGLMFVFGSYIFYHKKIGFGNTVR